MHARTAKIILTATGLASAVFIAACGGGGGGSSAPTTATGYFRDSAVSGLHYVSGSQSGETGADGRFTYEVGNTVTFSLGGLTFGTATGSAVVTPIELVNNGDSTNIAVQNRVRLLMALDANGDSTDGISISAAVRAAAAGWTTPDFTATEGDFASAVTTVLSDVASVEPGSLGALPSASAARTHLESTVRCSYAGAFKGTFSGDDQGQFGVMVDAVSGHITGVAYSTPYQTVMSLSGSTPMSYDQSHSFVTGTVSGVAATFTGEFTSANGVTGTWESEGTYTGSFSGSRVGGSNAAVYRFTGAFNGNDYGLFSIDVDANDNVTGIGYSVMYNEEVTITGTVSGTSVNATTSNGTQILGTLNTADGSLSGTWNNATEGMSGNYSGAGCRLN